MKNIGIIFTSDLDITAINIHKGSKIKIEKLCFTFAEV
jgi:hypothetical protein